MRLFEDTNGIRKRANRPHGRLPAANRHKEMLENAVEYAEMLSGHPDVVGATLTGGLSRGYGDELSEIDLNVYLTPKACKEWSIGKGPLPQGDHLGTHYHMDVSFLDYEKEAEIDWGLLKKWDSSYAKVLYDPMGMVEKLLNDKDVFTAEEKHSLTLGNYLDCVYYGDIAVRQWIIRRDPMAANQLINKAIPALCRLLFLANTEYPPFEKWLINYSHSLGWKPMEWEKRIAEVTLIRELTPDEARRRSTELMKLYAEVWAYIVGEEHRETGLLELETLEALEYVIEHSPTIKEFTEKYDQRQLGYEVLYKLADIEKHGEQERIVFNMEKYQNEKASGFPGFLDWNKRMLKHINK